MTMAPTSSSDQPATPDARSSSSSRLRWLQQRMAKGLALSAEKQIGTVRSMMERTPAMAVSYWLQLCLSIGIATLGLVLNSGGVVIGAMLIAPLMGPIVELAMALTVGSPLLMLRSVLRATLSIVIAVLGSATINLVLPFHELTAEIAARTTPTVIDLFVAVFCAFAAAFSTVRSGSETVSTAAGTSISIALVPPLCVVGFGLANLQWSVALGAALLFTANLSAILMFAALFFFAVGFDAVKAEPLEHEAEADSSRLGRLSASLWRWFGHRYGYLLRILVPLSLVLAVSVPLSHALATVAWEVRVRAVVQGILQQEIPSDRSVQSTLVVQNRQVSLRLVLVAKPERAKEIEQRLQLRIAQAAGVEPTLSVLAVPSDQAIREAALLLGRMKPIPAPVRPPEPDFTTLRSRLSGGIKDQWPRESAGPLLTWLVHFEGNQTIVHCTHLGSPLGAAGEELLERALTTAFGSKVKLRDHPIDPRQRLLNLNEPAKFWPELSQLAASVKEHPQLSLCVGLPEILPSKAPSASELERKSSIDDIRSLINGLGPQGIVTNDEQQQLRLRVSDGPCEKHSPSDGAIQSADGGIRTNP